MTLDEVGKRAGRAADILFGLVSPGDETRGTREDLHEDDVTALQAVIGLLGKVEDLLLPPGPPNRDGLRILREARDLLQRVPSWRLPDDDARRGWAEALRLIDNSLADAA